jgi:carboxyl-terminal processing protease
VVNGETDKEAPQLGQINLTMAKFYRVNGSSTQHKGVMPDVVFPSIYPLDKIGEDTEASALPWDVIPKSNYSPVSDLAAVKTQLVNRHKERMEKSTDYKLLVQDIADMQKRDKETAVTLNQGKLKAERDSLEAKSMERTNLIRTSRGLPALKKGEKVKKEETYDFIEDESMKVIVDLIEMKKA